MIDYLRKLVDSYPNHYVKMLKAPDRREVLEFVDRFRGGSLKEKVYVALNGEVDNRCLNFKNCGSDAPFISFQKGYRKYCDAKCQEEHLREERLSSAVDKLNSFGSLEYVSGYQNSHSRVTVKNKLCGCVFEAQYNNLFTNPNYCPVHGSELRTNLLLDAMQCGLSEGSKEKRRATFAKLREEKIQRVRDDNLKLETELFQSGRPFMNDFLNEMMKEYRSNLEIMVSRFPKFHKMIKDHYGDRFGQKAYNFIHDINSESDVPTCVECGNKVGYKIASNMYHEFCSAGCRIKSDVVVDRIRQSHYKKYGGWHTQTEEYLKKSRETCIKKYGVPHMLQNKSVLEKVWKSQFRLKPTALPSGRVVNLMGYEPQVLNHLLETRFVEEDFEFDAIPTFSYGRGNLYFPDFYVPDEDLIIEVKSSWTYSVCKEKNILKKRAVEDGGYEYELIVWCEKRGVITHTV